MNAYVLDRENDEVDTIDSSSRQVVKRRKLPGVPTDLVVADDHHLWVGCGDDRLVDIDLTSHKQVVTKTQIPPNYVAVLPHEVVIRANPDNGGRLQRVDIRTHRVTSKVVKIGGAPSDLVSNGLGVWVLMAFPPTVVRDSAALEQQEFHRLNTDGVPPEMTYDGTDLWVSLYDTGQVGRFDVVTSKTVGKPVKVGRKPNGIAYDLDTRSVWVADTGDETVTRLDGRTGRAIARVSAKGPLEGALAASGGVVWAAGTNDVVRIQPVGSS